MGEEAIDTFLADLPKCEHHVHIEGCLSPPLQFRLAERNKVKFPSDDASFESVASLEARYTRFTSLDDFLHYYYIGMSALITEQDFTDLALEYLRRAWADGVRHAEIFFDPQAHTTRGVDYGVVVSGLEKACRTVEAEHGMTTMIIPCFLRHLPAAGAMEALWQMAPDLKAGRLHGVGLCSSEVGFPCAWWKDVFDEAKAMGLRRTAHAGEEGGPQVIRDAIAELDVMRIDHGVAMGRDPELMRETAERGMLVTVCPVSNVQLKVFDSLDKVPIRALLEHGVKFSINSDDPAYFGAWTLDCYKAVQRTFGLGASDWHTICSNAIEGSWCSDDRKAELKKLLQQTFDKHSQTSNKKEKGEDGLQKFWSGWNA